MSQDFPTMEHSRLFSESKFVKQDTNCQNGLKMHCNHFFCYHKELISDRLCATHHRALTLSPKSEQWQSGNGGLSSGLRMCLALHS